MDIIQKFSQYLDSIEYPNEKTSWNIAGIIKGQNAFYKFDVRDMFKLASGDLAQKGTTSSKADKMVLEYKEKWIVLDLEELHKYLQENKKTRVYVEELINVLEWNIVLDK